MTKPFNSVTGSVRTLAYAALLAAGLAGCQQRYDELPAYSAERHLLQVVVETPAGTNRILRYNPQTNDFAPEQRAGTVRLVTFLPSPVNIGFVPATYLPATKRHPAGRPQPALVLAETQPPGTVLEVVPLALLLLDNAGEMEAILVTVPARPSQQILPVKSWRELTNRYPAAREVLRLWLQHSDEPGQVRVVGWRDEQAAEQQIRGALKR